MMKSNIIIHATTSCNYNCSYCDVIKDKKQLSNNVLDSILNFIKNNYLSIDTVKFFGGEPLIAWNNIKKIINETKGVIGKNYEIVTNATLLNDEVGEYFQKYFKIIFLSIDLENNFDYKKVFNFITKYKLEDTVYFNLVVNPGSEKESLTQFKKLYDLGYRQFNILPVYFTKKWSKENLSGFSKIMKTILDLQLLDNSLTLFGFQNIKGEESKLISYSFFIDIDGNIYYSDIVSTFSGKNLSKDLLLGNVNNSILSNIVYKGFKSEEKVIRKLEENIYNKVNGQRELEKLMDYFSKYLNIKNAK